MKKFVFLFALAISSSLMASEIKSYLTKFDLKKKFDQCLNKLESNLSISVTLRISEYLDQYDGIRHADIGSELGIELAKVFKNALFAAPNEKESEYRSSLLFLGGCLLNDYPSQRSAFEQRFKEPGF